MTTGLGDGVTDVTCTLPSCLQYKADAGTRWAYHNASYTLSVYPNPFTSSLTVDFDNVILNGKLQIVNQMGQILETITLNGNRFELSLMDLPKGIYWLQIKSESGLWVRKVVK